MTEDAELDRQTRLDFETWFESSASIKSHDGLSVIQPGYVDTNELQKKINDAIEWCESNNEPCKIIVLKNRKEGASTYFVGKAYHLLRSSVAHLLEIGNEFSTTQTIWDMLRFYQEHDGFQAWPNKLDRMTQSAQQGGGATWSHGSTAWADTAGDNRAGQSKTPTVILADEVAHWGRDGAAANASDTMLALLNSIVEAPGTYVFVSSTAAGVGNYYHRTYTGAATLEERKTGRKGNGWIKVFHPWHKSPWAVLPVSDARRNELRATLTESERRGIELWGWTEEQIEWRRTTIATKCDGDEAKFNQENPESESSAFIQSGRPVFAEAGMARLDRLVALAKPVHGVIDENARGLLWREDSTGWLTMFEPPMPGKNYITSLDTCRHEQSAGAKDPDEHAFFVLRKSYIDHAGRLIPTRVAARIRPPCRWDASVLAAKIALVLRLFGNCMIVPEANQGLDVINELIKLHCNVYRRQKFDRINPGKALDILGWETTAESRPILVKAIVDAVREETLDLECAHAIGQMRTFTYNARGKACAANGCHDDDVLSLGTGLACIESASVYTPAMPERWMLPGMMDSSDYGEAIEGNRACL